MEGPLGWGIFFGSHDITTLNWHPLAWSRSLGPQWHWPPGYGSGVQQAHGGGAREVGESGLHKGEGVLELNPARGQ